MNSKVKDVLNRHQEIARFYQIAGVLHWDQETYLPEKGHNERAEQLSLISKYAHSANTDKEYIKAIKDLAQSNLEGQEARFIYLLNKEIIKKEKLPSELIERKTRASSLAHQRWIDAKNNSDFSTFLPSLREIIDLQRQKIDILGYEDDPYDVLLDSAEPGYKSSHIQIIFDALEKELPAIVQALKNREVKEEILTGDFDLLKQAELGRQISRDLGYDFTRGRIDTVVHPFCTTLSSNDVRITTTYDRDNFTKSFSGCTHECGHAFYEMNMNSSELLKDYRNSILSQATSSGMHESQSRFVENILVKSRAFSKVYFSTIVQYFPQLSKFNDEDFFNALNVVRPSYIRTEADEVTYNLHIILRFNIERKILNKTLKLEDIPEYWNSEIKRLLGIEVNKDSNGCLQDVHWCGGIGGFVGYALGNLYSAQFHNTISNQLNLEDIIKNKEFSKVIQWLNTNIHQYGSMYETEDLLQKATGERLNPNYFISYLKTKFQIA